VCLDETLGPVHSKLLLEVGIALFSHVKLQQSCMVVADLIEQEIGVGGVEDGSRI
jgi:hypothetical protein